MTSAAARRDDAPRVLSMAATERTTKFNRVERPLHRALSMPIFEPSEQVIMQAAQELSYTASVVDGTRRPKAFRIHVSRLARDVEVRRETLQRALHRLIADNVLKGTPQRLWINKDYHTWRGGHALSPGRLRVCDAAAESPVTECGESFAATSKKAETSGPRSDLKVTGVTQTSQSDLKVTSVTQTSQAGVTQTSQECDPNVTKSAPPQTPLLGRQSIDSSSSRPTPTPSPTTDRLSPEIRALVERARQLAANTAEAESLPNAVESFASQGYPADWIGEALTAAELGAKDVSRRAKYMHKCLMEWKARGAPVIPRPAPASPAGDRTAATTSRPACQANPRNRLTLKSILED